MVFGLPHRSAAALATGLAGVLLLLAGCSSSSSPGKIQLSVATFGEFGYDSLYKEYEALHPDIEITGRVTDFDTHHKGLATQLAAGRGAADVEAIEEQYMPQFRQSADKFVNLSKYGADSLQGQWAPWKWQQGLADGGKDVMGLGTDIGSLAICYRKDLFAQAGLPTDRAAVAKLWPTWEAYGAVADRFEAKLPGKKFADSAGNIYTAILNQAPENFFSSKDDSFIADTNPNVHRAFYLAAAVGAKGQTAKVQPFTQPWDVAIKQGSFATMTCPAWMLTQIQSAGGTANAGKWDVASVPGGAGNWGGSWLTVPAQSAHPQEAYDLAKWLTAPEQEKKVFASADILPSEPAAYHDPSVLGKVDPYFSGAPVGELFAASADSLRPNYRGLKDADVRPVFGQALGRVEGGQQSVDDAWAQAIREARDAIK
jgi:cellobiose transport system substrate-binding protein